MVGEAKRKVVGNCFSVVHLAMQFELQLPADLAAFHTPLPTADSTKRIHTHKMCPAAAEGSGRRSAERGRGRGGARRRRKLGSVSVCNNFLCASSGFFFSANQMNQNRSKLELKSRSRSLPRRRRWRHCINIRLWAAFLFVSLLHRPQALGRVVARERAMHILR